MSNSEQNAFGERRAGMICSPSSRINIGANSFTCTSFVLLFVPKVRFSSRRQMSSSIVLGADQCTTPLASKVMLETEHLLNFSVDFASRFPIVKVHLFFGDSYFCFSDRISSAVWCKVCCAFVG